MRLMIIAVAASVLFSTPALTQQLSQGTGSVPDLSGVWAHPSIPGFEPPTSGPGPVINRERRGSGFGNPSRLVGDYTNPILKPYAAEVVRKRGEIALTRAAPSPSNQCWPAGVPYILWNTGIQVLQRPDALRILYAYNHESRYIRMNEPHPAKVTPSWYGDSVGHFESDTLVVDTVGIRIGPFSMVDWYGTPHSSALHVVERYRLIDYEVAKEGLARDLKENLQLVGDSNDTGPAVDTGYTGKTLQLQFTVDDPGVFTMPWSATVTYRRAAGEWPELVCAENTQEYYAKQDTAVPVANKPDF